VVSSVAFSRSTITGRSAYVASAISACIGAA
jgi:hypothetical protein